MAARTHAVVGMQHRISQSARRMMAAKLDEYGPFAVKLIREPENPHDYWALKVVIRQEDNPYDRIHIGYIAREAAAVYSPKLDLGEISVNRAYLMWIDPEEAEAEIRIFFAPRAKTKGRKTGQPGRKRRT